MKAYTYLANVLLCWLVTAKPQRTQELLAGYYDSDANRELYYSQWYAIGGSALHNG